MSGGWTVIACGDRSRGDDGAGPIAAAALATRLTGARVIEAGQLEPIILTRALRSGRCVVVDAVHGADAGSIVSLPLRDLLATSAVSPASSHALPIPMIVALAQALGADLGRGSFFGIGGASFELGAGLSGPVRQGLPALVAAIERAVAPETRTCA